MIFYGSYTSCFDLPTWSVPKTSESASSSSRGAATPTPATPCVPTATIATSSPVMYTPTYYTYYLPTFLWTWWYHTVQLHSLLTIMATDPRLAWNLAMPPRMYRDSLVQSESFSNTDEHSDILDESASHPPCTHLTVYHSNGAISQRWGAIQIHASSAQSPSSASPSSRSPTGYVTLGDLLEEIYVHFHRPLTKEDHEFFKRTIGLTDAALLKGFNERVSKSQANIQHERLQGYKRIDVLAGIGALDLKSADVRQGSDGRWVLALHT